MELDWGSLEDEIQEIAHRESVEVGPFTVGACRVSHDARDPMALAIIGPRCERLAIAYDLGRANPLVQALLRSAERRLSLWATIPAERWVTWPW